uniref:Metalloendopeptidase n=1 Tax=Peronospora matthiolae TaxID=2874970 RepID=A0AAV1UE73_9STRA
MASWRRWSVCVALAIGTTALLVAEQEVSSVHVEVFTNSIEEFAEEAAFDRKNCEVHNVTLRHRSLTYYDVNSYVACSNGQASCYLIERVHEKATEVACPTENFQQRIDEETAYRTQVAKAPVDVAEDDGRRRLSLIVVSTTRTWDGGVVCYEMSSEFPFQPKQKKYIHLAMGKYENSTNVRFVPLATCENERLSYCDSCANWVDFKHPTSGRDCNSSIGITDEGAQVMNLADRCFVVDDELKTVYGSAMHEIGHSIGLYHEHQHPSRSVAVFWDAIEQGIWSELAIRDVSVGGPYDQESVMHYPMSYGFCQPNFCNNSTVKTECVEEGTKFCNLNDEDDDCVDITKDMCNKTATEAIGQRKDLSAGDVAAINELYPTAAWPVSKSKIGV